MNEPTDTTPATPAYRTASTFCADPSDHHNHHEIIKRPYRVNGGWLATNGTCMVWINDPEMPDADRYADPDPIVTDALSKMESAINPQFVAASAPFDAPDPSSPPPPRECPSCNGTGHDHEPCRCCDGAGHLECKDPTCTDEHECETCSGTGETPSDSGPVCEECGGQGSVPVTLREVYAKTPGAHAHGIGLGYLREVNAALGAGTVWRFSASVNAAHLASGPNGAAIVMPMRRQ